MPVRRRLPVLPTENPHGAPQARWECVMGERPCPFVSCKYHLYLDVNPETGSLKINFPEREPWELSETCALDVADRAGMTLEEVGQILNLTRERIRQIEVGSMRTVRADRAARKILGADEDD